MRILGYTVARMYISAIILLVMLAGISAYLLGTFPYALIVAVLACSVIEAVIRRYQKQKLVIPFSGIITGLIIGCVAPINVPVMPLLVACTIAVVSKFFIKSKSTNVFNPAALGLFGLGLLSIGSSWWASTSVNIYGVAVSLAIVLVIAAYECKRLPLAFSFIIASAALNMTANLPLTLGSMAVAFLSVNYFFAFLMLTEPKTSPPKNRAQVVYGVYISVIYFLMVILLPPSLYLGVLVIFIALLVGNLTYAIFRRIGGMNGISMLIRPKNAEATG